MAENIGSMLQHARQAKELSLEEISDELFIRVPYLKALENGSFDQIPTKVQLRGFLRTYASYLGLPVGDILQQLTVEMDGTPAEIKTVSEENAPIQKAGEPTETTTAFIEIGQSLAHQRDLLGLSKDDIEAHTHIPAHYITFLETGAFENFPSPTQARGMLSNYANFLDLDTNALMLKYADALQARLTNRQEAPATTTKASTPSRPRISAPQLPPWVNMFFSPDTFLVGITGIAIIIFIIWGIGRISRTQASLEPVPTAPSLVEALLPTSTPAPTATLGSAFAPTLEVLDTSNIETVEEATAEPTIPITGSSIQVFLIIRQRTYLRVIVDGETAFDGRALADETYTFVGQEQIELVTGNAAAVQVVFNEQDMGTLGIFGEVTSLIYTREGVITPTPLPTATLSPEELATATPTATTEPLPGDDNNNLPPAQNTPIP